MTEARDMGSPRIAYDVDGTGPPIMLVHGLGYGRKAWGPLAGLLARRHTVIRPDNRGIGGSDSPPGPYSTAGMAADLLTLADRIELERFTLAGISLGGMVATEMALAAPERIDRLVLMATTPGGAHAAPMPAATTALMQDAGNLPPAEAMRRFVVNALGPDEPDPTLVEEIMAVRMATPQRPEAWAAQAAAGAHHDAYDRLPSIAMPTLVMAGTADRVVDPANASILAERIPDARLVLFPGLGHLFVWEDPDTVAATIEEWVDGR